MTSYTVTANNSDGSVGIYLQVEVLTGATEAGGASAAVQDGNVSGTTTLTPSFSGSFIAEAVSNAQTGLTSIVPATNNKLLTVAANTDSFQDSTNGYTTGAEYYSGTVTAGTPVTIGFSTFTGNAEIAAYEVPPSGVWAEDASTPAWAKTQSTHTITTASFTPPAGAVLVAVVTCNFSTSANPTTVLSVSSTPSLTWTARKFNANAVSNGGAAVFTATVPSASTAPFRAANFVRAKLPARQQGYPGGALGGGRVVGELAPGTGNISGPVMSGTGMGASGAPVRNPTVGPVFRQAVRPVKPALRLFPVSEQSGLFFSLTRRGPPGTQNVSESFSAGRVAGSRGAPVHNPTSGPPFRQLPWPVQAPDQVPKRGRAYGTKAAVSTAAVSPALFRPQGTVRARVAFNYPRAGSITNELSLGTGNIGSPVQGAGFGNAQGANGVPVRNPTAGPVFRPLHWPVQAPDPLPRHGRVYGVNYSGGPVQNPSQGPVFRQATQPARARQPLPARGRTGSNPGILFIPAGPVFTQRYDPARIRPALPPKGRTAGSQGAPLRNPSQGPVFRQAVQPVRARQPLPARGRVQSGNGLLVILTAGVQFYPARQPIRARIPQNAPRGRVYSNPGGPVRNPVSGPVFRQATQPARSRQPLPLHGRTGSNPGTAVFPLVVTPAVLHQGVVRARVPQPVRGGRTWSGKGAPVVVPAVFYPAVQPVKARLPVPFLKGRASSGPGTFTPGTGPVFRQVAGPVRIRPALPPRGRIWSNRGVLPPPVIIPAVFRPAVQAVRARQPLPLRGRVISNPGNKIRNPGSGPRFVQAVQPARKRIPANIRGRTYSHPGAPVQNVPVNRVLFTIDSLFAAYRTGDVFTGYDTDDTVLKQYRTGGMFTLYDTDDVILVQFRTGQVTL